MDCKEVRWSMGNSLVPYPSISQLEHGREQSQGAAAGGAGMAQGTSPSKEHRGNGARVLAGALST